MAGTRLKRGLTNNIFNALYGATNPNGTNHYVTVDDLLSVGIGTNIFVANNFSALPDPTTHSGYFYWVLNSQGTRWLPGTLGGTYYPNGLYYSTGVSWERTDAPYQASIAEVNAGLSDTVFLTPYNLRNSNLFTGLVSFEDGDKSSDTDAGTKGQMSITDDYVYICVQTGIAGSAIWKRFLITET